jgi:hypothetical protein
MELQEDNQIKCKSCGSRYPGAKNSYYLIDDNSVNDDQVKMMKWWNDLCMQWYTEFDKTLTSKKLESILPELEESFFVEDHLIFDLDLNNIKDKSILDIGCDGLQIALRENMVQMSIR